MKIIKSLLLLSVFAIAISCSDDNESPKVNLDLLEGFWVLTETTEVDPFCTEETLDISNIEDNYFSAYVECDGDGEIVFFEVEGNKLVPDDPDAEGTVTITQLTEETLKIQSSYDGEKYTSTYERQ